MCQRFASMTGTRKVNCRAQCSSGQTFLFLARVAVAVERVDELIRVNRAKARGASVLLLLRLLLLVIVVAADDDAPTPLLDGPRLDLVGRRIEQPRNHPAVKVHGLTHIDDDAI